ncbi:acyl-ACP thioesterase domain-containing protein [Streptococcus ictaluri]|uniref:Acyl-ACP thioesterase n=1 Tax=Streptococcus ictaluri 707-05 TaxID=764299 RepID=G5K2J5_9STRE|nr:acyl-ACP thioesterase domain-containing protein [Streptococcus ictaluri]EHI69863.1 acyl-ACP thioesterase [Streptococcus ictaluri 707-05]
MGLTYSEDFKVDFDFCDLKEDIKLPLFLSYCLSVSRRQSLSLNRSDDYLHKHWVLSWIVTDYDISINRLPHFNETIRIETQAIAYNRLFCYRKFHIYDQSGNVLMDILAYFALMNPITRRVAQIPDDLVSPYQAPLIKKMPRSPKMKKLEKSVIQLYKVRYFDIDMNGHVNNSKYLDWMYDALGDDFLQNHRPIHLTLKYLKEVSAGGQISSAYHLDGMTSYHDILSEGQYHAQAMIKWQKIEKESEINHCPIKVI